MSNKILIVDDEPTVLSSLRQILSDEPYDIFTADNGVEGLDILNSHDIKIIISDEKMPGMSGTAFLSTVKEMFPHTVRIMLTGHASMNAAMKAVNSGEIYRFFARPWNDIELKLAVRSAVEKCDLESENRELLKSVKET